MTYHMTWPVPQYRYCACTQNAAAAAAAVVVADHNIAQR
jgi:hypothetical protein